MCLYVVNFLSFSLAIVTFGLALAVQSDPSELFVFLSVNLWLLGIGAWLAVVCNNWISGRGPVGSGRQRGWKALGLFFMGFIVVNALFLTNPHWRYPPEWTGGRCYPPVPILPNSTCTVYAYLSPILGSCDVQRGVLHSSDANMTLTFEGDSMLQDLPVSSFGSQLFLEECSFYCGRARFFPKVKCGILIISKSESQSAPDRSLNAIFTLPMFFLPMVGILSCSIGYLKRPNTRDSTLLLGHSETVLRSL